MENSSLCTPFFAPLTRITTSATVWQAVTLQITKQKQKYNITNQTVSTEPKINVESNWKKSGI